MDNTDKASFNSLRPYILPFLSWKERCQTLLWLCREDETSAFKHLSLVLRNESFLYFIGDSKDIFLKAFVERFSLPALRGLPDLPCQTDIILCTRFNPKLNPTTTNAASDELPSTSTDLLSDNDDVANALATRRGVAISLHIRLRLLQAMHRRSGRSKAEMLKMIMSTKKKKAEGRGFQLVLSRNEQSTSESEGEVHRTQPCVLSIQAGEEEGRVVTVCPGTGLKAFKCGIVLPVEADQAEVYTSSGVQQSVRDFVNGRNATVLAYGQTESGKTHTLIGPPCALPSIIEGISKGIVSDHCGFVPRISKEIFTAKEMKERNLNVYCELKLSVVEVFTSHVKDLVSGRNVSIPDIHEGQAGYEVSSLNRISELLGIAWGMRKASATASSQRSSPAHILLFFHLSQSVGIRRQRSTLCVADLGGSEKVKKSLIGNDAERLQERIGINSSLLTLRQVVDAISSNKEYIPFQDSYLTQLLQTPLTTGGRLSLILTASRADDCALETIETLRFGEKLKSGVDVDRKKRQTPNELSEEILVRTLSDLDAEISECRAQLALEQNAEVVTNVRIDSFSGEREIITTTLAKGGEKTQKRLENLIERRGVLLGF